ncbi:hypothetical protein QVD17_07546 [Tagetes erecta]|uniref:Uncharacterized protein n=1 Tax=Tagetes erecta TaxID=13708 RepID=A0AAD8LHQ8_TARER|nr:hypothetical protein QVD17_07546 [Tagetes erecta]
MRDAWVVFSREMSFTRRNVFNEEDRSELDTVQDRSELDTVPGLVHGVFGSYRAGSFRTRYQEIIKVCSSSEVHGAIIIFGREKKDVKH